MLYANIIMLPIEINNIIILHTSAHYMQIILSSAVPVRLQSIKIYKYPPVFNFPIHVNVPKNHFEPEPLQGFNGIFLIR